MLHLFLVQVISLVAISALRLFLMKLADLVRRICLFCLYFNVFFPIFYLLIFVSGLRFESKIIPYKIYHYTNQLRNEDVDIEIARAFNLWAGYANRTFIQIKDNSRQECIQIS